MATIESNLQQTVEFDVTNKTGPKMMSKLWARDNLRFVIPMEVLAEFEGSF